MYNQIAGVFTVVLVFFIFFLAWKKYKQEKYNYSLLLILGGGLILLIFAAFDGYLNIWDEQFHALVAKNFILHPLKPTLYDKPVLAYDFANFTSNHIWLSKPPIPLWIMAFSIFLFGENELAVRLPSIIFALSSVCLTYWIASNFSTKKTALIAAFLHAINGLMIAVAAGRISSDHVETAFLFFVELSIVLAILSFQKQANKYWYILFCGLCIGTAILCKLMPALLVVGLWVVLYLIFKPFRIREFLLDFFILILSVCLLPLCWFLYIQHQFPKEAALFFQSLYEPLQQTIHNHEGSPFFYFEAIRIVFGELIYLPIIWLIYTIYKNKKIDVNLFVFLWIVIPFIVFSLSKTKRETYLLISAPAYFIVTAQFVVYLLDYPFSKKVNLVRNCFVMILFLLPFRYMIERVKPFDNMERTRACTQALKSLTVNDSKTLLFNYPYPIEAMFYKDLTAYLYIPAEDTLFALKERGYQIIIYQNDKFIFYLNTTKKQ